MISPLDEGLGALSKTEGLMSHSAPLEDDKVADLQRSIKVFVHDDVELERFCSPLTLQVSYLPDSPIISHSTRAAL